MSAGAKRKRQSPYKPIAPYELRLPIVEVEPDADDEDSSED